MSHDLQITAEMAALEFYVSLGVDEAIFDEPLDRTVIKESPAQIAALTPPSPAAEQPASTQAAPIGQSDAYKQAVKLASQAQSIEALKEAIAGFDGLGLKKTATNMVFASGDPESHLMIIGEAPEGEDDRQGQPFSGANGQLLDKMLGAIGLGRQHEELSKSVYLSNMLNWRPPGNRTPSPLEIEISLPFIERHIQLASPRIILIFGANAAKAILGLDESMSKLRKRWHEYTPNTKELSSSEKGAAIPTIVSYAPSYLLNTPLQKKAAWADLLMLKARLSEFK